MTTAVSVGEIIRNRLSELNISQTELAVRVGEYVQTISAIICGKREITIPLSVKLDKELDFAPGTIAVAQTRFLVDRELEGKQMESKQEKKMLIMEKIKDNGGFWSYSDIPQHLDDDSVIEASLIHLDLEDLPLLLGIWSKAHIKKIWKERLVSQGRRMNILNYILAVKLFAINNPDKYITRYAKPYNGKVKLSFFRPENPVKTTDVGLRYNNLKVPSLQDLLGMKVYALCVRSVIRDYYDIYCLLESGMKLEEAISYASYLSRHQIRSKTMYSRLLSPQLFPKGEDFLSMSPKYDVSPDDIRERIKQAIESENLHTKTAQKN